MLDGRFACYEARLVVIRMLSSCALVACQSQASPPVAVAPSIEVRDGQGGLIGELRASHPCRTRIGPIEMQVGGPPLVSQLGSTRLTGSAVANHGTALASDGQVLVRVVPSADAQAIDVLDPSNAPLLHVESDGTGATVRSAARDVLHRIALRGDELVFDGGAQTVRGTHDAVLAALLVTPELLPEVRMLVACDRAWGGK